MTERLKQKQKLAQFFIFGLFVTRSLAAECPSGKYSIDGTDDTQCNSCVSGQFQTLTGQASCIDCAQGMYAGNSAAPSCDYCFPGQYSSVSAAVKCEVCNTGQYSAGNRAMCIFIRAND